MQIPDTLWIKGFNDFAKKNNATFHLHKNPSLGYHSEYLTCSVIFSYRSKDVVIKQQGIKSNDEVALSFVVIEYEYENWKNFSLSLSRREFFDKLFSAGSLKTGSEQFDKSFTISTSDKILARKIFGDEQVQELFLGNQFLLFNVQTQNGVTSVKLKSMEQKLYSQDELQILHDEFILLIDKLY